MSFVRTAIITVLLFSSTLIASDLEIKAGLGYDYFSQEFFVDSTSQAGVDSFLTEWSLKSNYLDDFKAIVNISFFPDSNKNFEFQTRHEQTNEFYRTRFISDLYFKKNNSKIKIYNELELKNKTKGITQPGDEYFLGYSKIKFSHDIGKNIYGNVSMKGDFVNFDSTSEVTYNYYRFGGNTGITKYFDNFSLFDWNLFFDFREVPDTNVLNYNSYGSVLNFSFYHNKGEMDFYSRIENKLYNQLQDKDNHIRFESIIRNKLYLSNITSMVSVIDFSLVNYTGDYLTNKNYNKLKLELLANLDYEIYVFSAGPVFENLSEEENDLFDSENYFEIGLKLETTIFKPNLIFGTIESILGHRNLDMENEFQSNYTFERLSLMADLNITHSLNLNFLFTSEWEWHNNSNDNTRIYLLSSNLSFRF